MMEERPIGSHTYSPAIVSAKNYQRWIYDALKSVATGAVLEIGVGSAPFVEWYDHVDEWFAADVDSAQVNDAIQKWNLSHKDFPAQGVVGNAGENIFWEKFENVSIDGIICVNVLEHIEDDLAFMHGAFKLLSKRGGRLGLFVPAMPWIYGSLDRVAGHFRRYDKHSLILLAESAGFVVDSLKYFNALGALLWYWQGNFVKTNDLNNKGLNKGIERFDQYAVPVIKEVERILPPLFGQSLVLIAHAKI
jgi:predicted SAM-dependent methyltransferase